ncbi:MAG: RNA polymerase sigma factor [Clostridia bacterium]|nr:RNA polymerase sigma factor [Clostridia bacterium]
MQTIQPMFSLDALYREHRQRMYAVAHAILHNEQEAEDAVHDAFVRLAENRHRLHIRSEEESRALLTAIARNAAIDRLRRRDNRCEPLPAVLPDLTDHPADLAEANDLLACVRRLPPHYRDVLLLVSVQGYSRRETASLLGITETTVRKRLSRGRELLQKRGRFDETE